MTGRARAQEADGAAALLLVGGGHAHVAVLADRIRRGAGAAGPPAVLLTPEPTLRYSGMVPGWITGAHAAGDGLVDLAALAARAGARLVQGRCAALDPEARVATTADGQRIGFRIASFDTGGVARGSAAIGDDPRLVEVRPISGLVARLAALGAAGRRLDHVVVAGGGAGGVELAFALRNAGSHLVGPGPRPRVTLATGAAGLLPGFAATVRRHAARALARQRIALVTADARFEDGILTARGRPLEPVDLVVAATGSAAPPWVRASGIATDPAGFLAVDAHHRSVSHPHIMAAGDVAARLDRPLARSGVHAVFAGPVLAANLASALAGQAPRAAYRPRRASLYLLGTGDGRAIASYGPLAAEGRWVMAWKHWIDRRWIAGYAALAGKG